MVVVALLETMGAADGVETTAMGTTGVLVTGAAMEEEELTAT